MLTAIRSPGHQVEKLLKAWPALQSGLGSGHLFFDDLLHFPIMGAGILGELRYWPMIGLVFAADPNEKGYFDII